MPAKSGTEMACESTSFSLPLIHPFLWSFFSFLIACNGYMLESEVSCLKSIKNSLVDPQDALSSWDFSNNTKDYKCEFVGVSCSSYNPEYSTVVVSIQLGHMGLKGQFPLGIIQKCNYLKSLNLSFNSLSGYIRSDIFNRLLYLEILDLSHNDFFGNIPTSHGSCTGCMPWNAEPTLQTLVLSYNKFSGEIPANITHLTKLHILMLDNNRLTGEIPPQLGQLIQLEEFSVAKNLLSGSVPVFADNVIVNYTYNSRLSYRGHLEPCDLFNQSFREGFIPGYVFSAVGVVVIYLSYCVPWTQLKKRIKKNMTEQGGECLCCVTRKKEKKEEKGSNLMRKLLPLKILQKLTKKITRDESLTYRMSFTELSYATHYFSVDNYIGVGKMGMMYKAKLRNGWSVAVKRLYDSQQFKRQFDLEIMIPGRYRHRNLVPLLGFCKEKMGRVLVYKYMPNGRLSDWLGDDMRLEWPVRVKIALGIARGLSWLHHSLYTVHLSISSESVLLDHDFEPTLSNFGEAKFINQNNYIGLGIIFDVDNGSNNEVGIFEKKDVYDFGTVLFELITANKFSQMTDSFNSYEIPVPICTTNLSSNPSGFFDAIDKSLIGKGFEDEIFSLLRVACDCIQRFPDQRPTMLQVYKKMSNIWKGDGFSEDSETSKQSENACASTNGDEIIELGCP